MKAKKGAGATPPPSRLEIDADAIRARIEKLTSRTTMPDPLEVRPMNVVSSGFLSLDAALGVGGFPKGSTNAIEGEPDGGKTILTAAIIGNWQRLDPTSVHAFLDVEGKTRQQLPFLQSVGLDTDRRRFLLIYPESAEEAAEVCITLLGYVEKDGKWTRDLSITPVTSITWDSWAGSPVDTTGRSALARVGSEWWPRLSVKASRVGTTVFVINQIREKPTVTFGDPRYSPGGSAFKFSQTTRIWVTRSNARKDEITKAKIGHDLRVDLQRSKMAAPAAPIYLRLNYGTGFDRVFDAASYYELRGITHKEKASGSVYSFGYLTQEGDAEEIRVTGKDAFFKALYENSEAAQAFVDGAQILAAKDSFEDAEESDDSETS